MIRNLSWMLLFETRYAQNRTIKNLLCNYELKRFELHWKPDRFIGLEYAESDRIYQKENKVYDRLRP